MHMRYLSHYILIIRGYPTSSILPFRPESLKGTCVHVCSVAQTCLTLCDAMDHNLPGSSVRGFSRQNTEVGCHFLLQGIFPVEIEPASPVSPALAGRFFTTEPPEAQKALNKCLFTQWNTCSVTGIVVA